MSVREILRSKSADAIVSISPSARVAEAAELLMRHGVGGLPVVDDTDSIIGFVSERDVVAAVDLHPENVLELRVAFIMRRPAPVCRSEDSIQHVMARMTRERVRHLVVMDDARVEGVISVGDLVKHRLEELETETAVLRDYVAAQRARA